MSTLTKPKEKIDLSNLTVKELEELSSKSQKEALRQKRIHAIQARRKVEAFARELGYSLKHLIEATGGFKGRTEPKDGTTPLPAPKLSHVIYRNPSDPTQVWHGRGRKPKWITAAVMNGADISSLKVRGS